MKNLNDLQGNELWDFAKESHKYYMDNLQFGDLDVNIVLELSNLIYYIENYSSKRDQGIKNSLNWLKNNKSNMLFK